MQGERSSAVAGRLQAVLKEETSTKKPERVTALLFFDLKEIHFTSGECRVLKRERIGSFGYYRNWNEHHICHYTSEKESSGDQYWMRSGDTIIDIFNFNSVERKCTELGCWFWESVKLTGTREMNSHRGTKFRLFVRNKDRKGVAIVAGER